jgi:glycosyltransferase involved in cell wall biosynthesis
LHVVAGAPTGGAETFSRDAILALAERGVEQHVICRPHPQGVDRYKAAGIPYTTLGFSRLERFLGAGRRIRRLAETFRADLVHAWMGRAASFIPTGMPCPVAGWFGGYYNLKYYPHADYWIAITTDMVTYLLGNGVPAHRLFKVHTFGTVVDEPPASRAALDTPEGVPVVLALSRMHRKKGIDTLLDAVARCPGVYAWLAGEGPEKQRYEALAKQIGLTDRVRFLGWRTDRSALLKSADLVALPSRYEPFGTVIPEAWGMSKPLVATRAQGASQYVTDGVNGLLCPIDEPAALAECIMRVVEDEPLRNRLVEGGKEIFERLFSKNAVITEMLAAYQAMIEGGPASNDPAFSELRARG